MRLLRAHGEDLVLETVDEESHPQYAILSHRWLAAEEEVTYTDIINGDSNTYKLKAGMLKLDWCRRQAIRDGHRYVWADTACIDKSSSQELTESINSMYRWYQKARICYVYLSDVPDRDEGEYSREAEQIYKAPSNAQRSEVVVNDVESYEESSRSFLTPLDHGRTSARRITPDGWLCECPLCHSDSSISGGWNQEAFGKSEWFNRAWTLQELIAPKVLKFYNKNWNFISVLQDIAPIVATITGINVEVLTKHKPLNACSIAQKMSWSAGRRSTRIEDRAVS